MHLFKFLRSVARLTAFVVVTAVYWTCFELEALVRGKRRRNEMINKWVPRWARTNLWIYGIKVDARGSYANDGRLYPACGANGVGRIFVMNHRSGLDIPILLAVAEAHVISRHDLATWPLLGSSARRVGTLFVDRESRRSGASVLKEVARVLANGEAVAMFPEGTVHAGDEVYEFRPGAFNTARRADAEIVPLGIAYDDDAAYYRKEPFMTHAKRIAGLPRLRVAIEIGAPFQVADGSQIETKENARKQVQELVDRARARLNRG